jgi:hypothetical protein
MYLLLFLEDGEAARSSKKKKKKKIGKYLPEYTLSHPPDDSNLRGQLVSEL